MVLRAVVGRVMMEQADVTVDKLFSVKMVSVQFAGHPYAMHRQ